MDIIYGIFLAPELNLWLVIFDNGLNLDKKKLSRDIAQIIEQ